MNNDRILAMLGMATRAGKTVSGEYSVENAVKSGKAFSVIIAVDVSENTKKLFTNMCSFYRVPLYIYGTKEILGHCMGKEYRASLALVDQGFSKTVEKLINQAAN